MKWYTRSTSNLFTPFPISKMPKAGVDEEKWWRDLPNPAHVTCLRTLLWNLWPFYSEHIRTALCAHACYEGSNKGGLDLVACTSIEFMEGRFCLHLHLVCSHMHVILVSVNNRPQCNAWLGSPSICMRTSAHT